jgi:dynein light chain roadblock-type
VGPCHQRAVNSDCFSYSSGTRRATWPRTLYVSHYPHASCCLTSAQPDETLSLLTRLSQKPGVQSTLILSRENGTIIRTSGLISNSSSANPNSTLPASGEAASDNYSNGRKESGIHSAEDVASMVWSFLTAAGNLVDELDKEDEVKLLRLRTRKNELVIVPGMLRTHSMVGLMLTTQDTKFILVLIHDTPPA